MKIQTIWIPLAIIFFQALLVQPVNAFTLENNLNYPFPDNFSTKIEAVEKQHDLQFFIRTQEFAPSKVPLFHDAGTDAADKLRDDLMHMPNYDPDKYVGIVWLRSTENTTKSKMALTPGGRVKEALPTMDERNDLILRSVKSQMPQSPSGAIVNIAQNIGQELVNLANVRRAVTIIFYAIGVGIVLAAIWFGLGWLANYLAELAEQKRKLEEATKAYEDEIHRANEEYLTLSKEEPAIFFDLKMILGQGAPNATFEDYRVQVAEYAKILNLAKENQKVTIANVTAATIKHMTADLQSKLKAVVSKLKKIEENLGKIYGDWLANRGDLKYFQAKLAAFKSELIIDAPSCKCVIQLENRGIRSELETLLNTLPLSFADYSRLEQGLNTLSSIEKEAAAKMQEVCKFLAQQPSEVGKFLNVSELNGTATPAEFKEYNRFLKEVQRNLELAPDLLPPVKESILASLRKTNSFVPSLEMIAEFEDWCSLNIVHPKNEANKIANACRKRLEQQVEAQRAVERAKEKKRKEQEEKEKAAKRSAYGSSYGSFSGFYTETDDYWGSSSRSSSSSHSSHSSCSSPSCDSYSGSDTSSVDTSSDSSSVDC